MGESRSKVKEKKIKSDIIKQTIKHLFFTITTHYIKVKKH